MIAGHLYREEVVASPNRIYRKYTTGFTVAYMQLPLESDGLYVLDNR